MDILQEAKDVKGAQQALNSRRAAVIKTAVEALAIANERQSNMPVMIGIAIVAVSIGAVLGALL